MDLSTLNDSELDDLRVQVGDEQVRRRVIADAPAQSNDIAKRYSEAVGRDDGQEWVQPTGAFDAYPLPSTVTHAGKTWENLTPANVWAPGVAGWREVTTGGGLASWIQPAGALDAYSFGDRVQHGAHAWTSNNPGTQTNTWEPGVYGWTDDGPYPAP